MNINSYVYTLELHKKLGFTIDGCEGFGGEIYLKRTRIKLKSCVNVYCPNSIARDQYVYATMCACSRKCGCVCLYDTCCTL